METNKKERVPFHLKLKINTMKQQLSPQGVFMDVKRLIINRLVGLGLLAVGILVSCSAPTAFVPVPSPNPWADDYTALSSMENYKQWGTYNVHDPACKKIGDTYYLYLFYLLMWHCLCHTYILHTLDHHMFH